ncbi:hypothetical protein ACFX2F_019700 [Malus domestica]
MRLDVDLGLKLRSVGGHCRLLSFSQQECGDMGYWGFLGEDDSVVSSCYAVGLWREGSLNRFCSVLKELKRRRPGFKLRILGINSR